MTHSQKQDCLHSYGLCPGYVGLRQVTNVSGLLGPGFQDGQGAQELFRARLRRTGLVGKGQGAEVGQQAIAAEDFAQHPPRRQSGVGDEPQAIAPGQARQHLGHAGDRPGRIAAQKNLLDRPAQASQRFVGQSNFEKGQHLPQPVFDGDGALLLPPGAFPHGSGVAVGCFEGRPGARL